MTQLRITNGFQAMTDLDLLGKVRRNADSLTTGCRVEAATLSGPADNWHVLIASLSWCGVCSGS